MHNEQIFTPLHIVDEVLDNLSYYGSKIRKKHIVDNSCGKGIFLCEAVRRYINVCLSMGLPKEETVIELETYIHGIELDNELCLETIKNLNDVAKSYSIENKIHWDIINCDAMDFVSFNGKMDYVVGNPPYCNVHDLGDKYDKVKAYNFAQGGMTDLYLVFFEIGINMLNSNGVLGYITSNGWLTSKAGECFRNYLMQHNILRKIIHYGHIKVFDKVGTYTCITLLDKSKKENDIYWENRENKYKKYTVMDSICFDGKFYLLTDEMEKLFNDMRSVKNMYHHIRCKNGF